MPATSTNREQDINPTGYRPASQRRGLPIVALVLTAIALSGCAPLFLGGAALTATAAAQERGLGGTISDTEIQAQINHFWFQHSLDLHHALDITVHNGKVLLTGVARDPEMRLDAVRLAWQARGVQEVINEIQLDRPSSLTSASNDTWITTRVHASLMLDRDVQSINYSVETVNGIVYVMGVASSPDEMRRVLGHIRNTPRVERVVNYIQLCCQQALE